MLLIRGFMKQVIESKAIITTVILCIGIANVTIAAPVRVEGGLIEGTTSKNLTVYRGIPFAAPPVGELRWRAPQPVIPWQGIRKTDQFSPECMQAGAYPPDAPAEPQSEDCLYLNIWEPVTADKTRLPVMVWIYGGGLTNGAGSIPLYSGDVLASKGVIVVTFNYRLGVFGFLADSELTKESPHHSSGDYGLLDQITALKWVHRNIAAFGGDPNNVTVFGQSSGSISISALTASPLTKGLFQRAIGESGGLFEPMTLIPDLSLAGAEQQGQRFMKRAGAMSIATLRKMSTAELMKIPFNTNLIIDGYTIQRPPYNVYSEGEQNPVELLIGSNADEGQIFIAGHKVTPNNLDQVLEDEGFPKIMIWLLGPRKPATNEEARAAAATFNTDVRFRWDMWSWARLATEDNRQKTYLYEFTRASPYPKGSIYAGLGATHGMEMPYVFGHLYQRPAAWTMDDRRLSEDMVSYWTNFAKYGDPNGQGLPTWPEYTRANPQIMYLGLQLRPGTVENQAHLKQIGRFYSVARFVITHIYLIIIFAILCLVLIILAFSMLIYRRYVKKRKLLEGVCLNQLH
jgi:para-nitrobenzyl esterase